MTQSGNESLSCNFFLALWQPSCLYKEKYENKASVEENSKEDGVRLPGSSLTHTFQLYKLMNRMFCFSQFLLLATNLMTMWLNSCSPSLWATL